MARLLLSLMVFAVLFIATTGFSETRRSVSVVDDTGTTIALAQPAQKIISLAPHTTELLFAAGAGDKVIGVVSYSNYPEQALTIKNVGSYNQFDFEQIALLQPDLIVGWASGNPKPLLEKLEQLGLPIFLSEPNELEDIANNIVKIGTLAGTSHTAQQAANKYSDTLNTIKQQHRGKPSVSVFYEIWHSPLMTLGGDHLFNKVLALCSATNAFGDLNTLAPKIDVETVLQRNPDMILASGMDTSRPDWLDLWLQWPQLRAVKNKHLYFVPPDYLQRHSPRLAIGAEMLCEHVDKVRQENVRHKKVRQSQNPPSSSEQPQPKEI